MSEHIRRWLVTVPQDVLVHVRVEQPCTHLEALPKQVTELDRVDKKLQKRVHKHSEVSIKPQRPSLAKLGSDQH